MLEEVKDRGDEGLSRWRVDSFFLTAKPDLYFPIRSNRASMAASFVSTSSR